MICKILQNKPKTYNKAHFKIANKKALKHVAKGLCVLPRTVAKQYMVRWEGVEPPTLKFVA